MGSKEKVLSVLVAAIVGKARLIEKRGGTEASHAVDRCRKRMARGIDGFRGRILTRTNLEQLTAVFDNPDAACQAAIAMQQRVADLPPVAGVQLGIRIGVQHGPVSEKEGEALGDGLTVAEQLAELATGGQILTSGETRGLLSAHLQSTTHGLAQTPDTTVAGSPEIFEVSWLKPKATPAEIPEAVPAEVAVQPPAPAKEGKSRLCVRYRGRLKLLDKHQPRVLIGRDASCEITIRNRRASRNHAKIERRGEDFVLRDLSTNGTFVTVNGEQELFVRGEEFVLRGSGIIAFAASANTPEADIAEFEHV